MRWAKTTIKGCFATKWRHKSFRLKKAGYYKRKPIGKAVCDDQIPLQEAFDNFRFSAVVASFGMLLSDSKFKSSASLSDVLKMAKGAKARTKKGTGQNLSSWSAPPSW